MNILTLIQLGMKIQAGLDLLLKYGVPQTIRGIKYKGKVFQATIAPEAMNGDLIPRAAAISAVEGLQAGVADLLRRADANAKGDVQKQLDLFYSYVESSVENLKIRIEMLP